MKYKIEINKLGQARVSHEVVWGIFNSKRVQYLCKYKYRPKLFDADKHFTYAFLDPDDEYFNCWAESELEARQWLQIYLEREASQTKRNQELKEKKALASTIVKTIEIEE